MDQALAQVPVSRRLRGGRDLAGCPWLVSRIFEETKGALAIFRRWEWTGGVLLSILAPASPVMTRGEAPWIAYLFMCDSLRLIAALFLANWIYRLETRTDTRT